MAKQVNIELMHFKSIREWKPQVGDMIIKHGWITRTKWFGVVNFINPDGVLDVVKDGIIKLLVMTPPDSMSGKTIKIIPDHIRLAMSGSYAVQQQDHINNNTVVWYV